MWDPVGAARDHGGGACGSSGCGTLSPLVHDATSIACRCFERAVDSIPGGGYCAGYVTLSVSVSLRVIWFRNRSVDGSARLWSRFAAHRPRVR